MEIISQKYVTLPEVKDIIKERKKEKAEFGFEHEQTKAYVEEFSKLSSEKAKELMKKLSELNIEEKYAVQIVNLLPKSVAILKLIFEKAENKPDEKEMNAILGIVKDVK